MTHQITKKEWQNFNQNKIAAAAKWAYVLPLVGGGGGGGGVDGGTLPLDWVLGEHMVNAAW